MDDFAFRLIQEQQKNASCDDQSSNAYTFQFFSPFTEGPNVSCFRRLVSCGIAFAPCVWRTWLASSAILRRSRNAAASFVFFHLLHCSTISHCWFHLDAASAFCQCFTILQRQHTAICTIAQISIAQSDDPVIIIVRRQDIDNEAKL